MRPRDRSHEPPLTLVEVLEEEYLTLHGPLPDSYRRGEYADDEQRLAALYRLIHGLPAKRSALALSGGGIRSATFSLGVVQALSSQRLLEGFDYLSSVSGGGYLGSWLTAWVHRHPAGLSGVADEIRGEGKSKLQSEPDPVRHLRAFSNYLTPRLGLMSTDTWTLVAAYLRNLLLNWLILLPLFGVLLVIPRLTVAMTLASTPSVFTMRMVPAASLFLLVVATVYVGLNRPSGGRCRMGQGWFLALCLSPLLVAGVLMTSWWCWYRISGAAFIPLLYLTFGAMSLKIVSLGGIDPPWNRVSGWTELFAYSLTGALGGALLWIASTCVFPDPARNPLLYTCLGMPIFLLIFSVAEAVFVGIVSYITEDEDREWWARFGAWVLLSALAWGFVSSLVIYGPEWFLRLNVGIRVLVLSAGGLAGIIAILAAWSSRTTGAAGTSTGNVRVENLLKKICMLAGFVFSVYLLVLLSLGTSWLLHFINRNAGQFNHISVVTGTGYQALATLVCLLLAVSVFMGLFIDINKFSLHAVYRSRLIRAYLGASRGESERKPNPFTGFDPDDDVYMSTLQPPLLHAASFANLPQFLMKIRRAGDPVSAALLAQLSKRTREALNGFDPGKPVSRKLLKGMLRDLNGLLQEKMIFAGQLAEPHGLPEPLRILLASDHGVQGQMLLNRMLLERAYPEEIAPHPVARPLHVINMALNLVRGQNLAWQQRKAESFTVTSLHSGNCSLGYRRSSQYGGKEGISLGTAVAISGAVASPNMGYNSSSALTFLMAVFNARLGWWLGNPGDAGWRSYRRSGPGFAVGPMTAEAFGLTDDTRPYVYLSDGGHFENLGLYEMVLRRCHFILASDAGEDPDCSFEDLGNAIRKIRTDLGVPIDFRTIPIYSRKQAKQGSYFTVGLIRYSHLDAEEKDGLLLYIKPAFYAREPADVIHYALSHPTFPHESTADQWFSESQFESYRALGYYVVGEVVEQVCGSRWQGNLEGFIRKAGEYVSPANS